MFARGLIAGKEITVENHCQWRINCWRRGIYRRELFAGVDFVGQVITGREIFFPVEESLPKDVSLSEKSFSVKQSFRRRILSRFEVTAVKQSLPNDYVQE